MLLSIYSKLYTVITMYSLHNISQSCYRTYIFEKNSHLIKTEFKSKNLRYGHVWNELNIPNMFHLEQKSQKERWIRCLNKRYQNFTSSPHFTKWVFSRRKKQNAETMEIPSMRRLSSPTGVRKRAKKQKEWISQ